MGVIDTDEPNPELLLVETSNPVGAVTVRSADKSEPETDMLPASEGVFTVVKRPEAVPKADTEGSPPE